MKGDSARVSRNDQSGKEDKRIEPCPDPALVLRSMDDERSDDDEPQRDMLHKEELVRSVAEGSRGGEDHAVEMTRLQSTTVKRLQKGRVMAH